MLSVTALLILLLSLILPTAGSSQTLDSLRPGDSVRYRLASAWTEGTYLGSIADSLRLGQRLAIGIVALSEGCGQGFPDTCIITPGEIAVGAPLALGAVGAGLGALIGAGSHRERWIPVAGIGSGITLAPHRRAVTIGVSLRL